MAILLGFEFLHYADMSMDRTPLFRLALPGHRELLVRSQAWVQGIAVKQ